MFASISLIALAFAAASPSESLPQSIGGALNGIFTGDDYPPEALDRNEQGLVGVVVKVDERGSVADCQVEKTSGSAALDAATCRVIWTRAVFRPAADAHGRPVPGEIHSKIRWQIGEDWMPNEPWASRMVANYTEGGSALSCSLVLEGAMAPREGQKPPSCVAPPLHMALPASLLPAGPVTQVIMEDRFMLDPLPEPAVHPGDKLMGRQELDLEIDAEGKVTSCRIVRTIGPVPPRDPCATMSAKTFHPVKGSTGANVPFKGHWGSYFYVGAGKTAVEPPQG